MIPLMGALEADLMTSLVLDVTATLESPSVQPAWLLSLDHHYLLRTTSIAVHSQNICLYNVFHGVTTIQAHGH